jgi:hypothetical protein
MKITRPLILLTDSSSTMNPFHRIDLITEKLIFLFRTRYNIAQKITRRLFFENL